MSGIVKYIIGSNENDTLYGSPNFANLIAGKGGDDILYGNVYPDYLYGGTGNDILYGGGGTDVFMFDTAPGPDNVDSIMDYVAGYDVIKFENAIFTALTTTGYLSADAFCTGAAAQDADDRIIHDTATGALYYDADGTGAAAQVQFATLVGVTGTVSNADFIVY